MTARTMVIFGALVQGALLTIAVAWGCRFVAQFDHETDGAHDLMGFGPAQPWSASSAEWGWVTDGPSGDASVVGSDRRVFVWSRSKRPSLETDGFHWNDFGVEFVAVAAPIQVTFLAPLPEHPELWKTPFEPSSDPADWIAPADAPLPAWSSLESEPLVDDTAVIEIASGWPCRALIARHRLSDHPGAALPWNRDTTGARFGLPYDDETLHELPYGVLPLGFALNTAAGVLFVALPIVLLFMYAGFVRARWRRRRRRCVHCAYVLDDGASDSACSECGRAPARWRPRFGRPAFALWGLNVALLAMGVIHVGAFRLAPETTPFEDAAYAGDVETMRALASAPGFTMPRGTHGGVHPPAIGGRAGQAARSADQSAVFRMLLELEGITPKPPDAMYFWDEISAFIGLLDRTSVWPEICAEHDLLRTGRCDQEDMVAHVLASTLTQSDEGRALLLATLRDHPDTRVHLWPAVVVSGIHSRAIAHVRSVLPFAPDDPPPVLARDRVGRVLLDFAYRDQALDSTALTGAERRELVAEIAHALVPDQAADPSAHTIATVFTLGWVVEVTDDEGFAAALDFLRTLPPPSRGDILHEFELFEPYSPTSVSPDRGTRWIALRSLGITPNLCQCSISPDRTPLGAWAVRGDSAALVRALLEAGAIITDRILDNATPENTAIMRAWIEETGARVYEHDVVYPPGIDTYAQIPGADDAPPR